MERSTIDLTTPPPTPSAMASLPCKNEPSAETKATVKRSLEAARRVRLVEQRLLKAEVIPKQEPDQSEELVLLQESPPERNQICTFGPEITTQPPLIESGPSKIHHKDSAVTNEKTSRIQDTSSGEDLEEVDFSSPLESPMVKIFLGPKRKRFTVHSGLVCASSKLFKSHFGDPHKLSTKILYLNDDDPAAFTKYIHFLYHKELEPITVPTAPKTVNGTSIPVHKQRIDETSNLLKLHHLAHVLDIPALKNLVLDQLNQYMDDAGLIFTLSQLKHIWQSTAGSGGGPTHPLRRFAVDQFIFDMLGRNQDVKVRQSYLKPLVNVATRDFVLEVVEALIWTKKYPAPTDPRDKGKCAYHVHRKGEKCPD